MPFLLPPIDTWAQWSSLFDDVRGWRPVVDAICEREAIVYDRIEAPASNTNAVFILDRRVVIKIYSPFWPEFAFERRLMELLERDAVVPVPAVLAVGGLRDRRDGCYLAMKFCAGRSLEELQPELARAALLEIAAHTGRTVGRLHAIDPRPLAAIDRGESWEALVAAHTVPHVVVHGDLNAEHVLLEQRVGRWIVAALLDFGDARIGVPDFEWMPLWLGLCNRDIALLRAFLETYDPALLADRRLGRRIAAWTLLHDFGTDAIAELFESSGAPRPAPSLGALQDLVWPGIWPARQISGAPQRRTGGGTGTG